MTITGDMREHVCTSRCTPGPCVVGNADCTTCRHHDVAALDGVTTNPPAAHGDPTDANGDSGADR